MAALKITGQSAEPTVTSSDAGTMYYDSDTNKLRHYNGSAWADVSPAAAAITAADLPAGSVIQVISSVVTSQVDNSSGTGASPVYVDVISAAITPSSGTKILVMADWPVGSNVHYAFTRMLRDSTVLNQGTPVSSQHAGVYVTQPHAGDIVNPYSVSFIDAAHGGDGATAITYKGQMSAQTGGNIVYAGRSYASSNNSGAAGINLTLIEIAA